ncbi:MAG TPA: AbrB/MazE/SpoVT family DNA-binding domain-containing protein [Acetobacteraceae bacterium]
MGTTLKVTAKGQVTLRKQLLDHLGVVPGDKIVVDFLAPGRAAVRAARLKATIDDFIGCLRRPGGPTLSIDEINEVAAAGWAGKA